MRGDTVNFLWHLALFTSSLSSNHPNSIPCTCKLCENYYSINRRKIINLNEVLLRLNAKTLQDKEHHLSFNHNCSKLTYVGSIISQAVSDPSWGGGVDLPIHHSGNMWQCLETHLVVPTAVGVGRGDNVLFGIQWVKARDVAQHTKYRTALPNKKLSGLND